MDPPETSQDTVIKENDSLSILQTVSATLCIIAERLSVRQLIPRRFSEIVCMYVCMYVCIRHA